MTNHNDHRTYSIQQVSELTGLSKQVIRKWEERYGVIHPERLDNGYRIYTNQEVSTLKRIKSLTENGTSVKQAIIMLNKERSEPSSQPLFIHMEEDIKPTSNYTEQIISKLLDDGFNGRDISILHTLQQAHHTLGLKVLIYDVIIPFLKAVGDRWHTGEWEEFKEALSTQVVRDFLANLRRNLFVPEGAPVILGSCLPNERHEIPLHILMLQSMLLGYRAVMLGPSPAPNAIQDTISQTNPKIVLLSAVTTSGFEDGFKTIHDLDEFAGKHQHIRFYIGGSGAISALQNLQLNYIKLADNVYEIFQESKG